MTDDIMCRGTTGPAEESGHVPGGTAAGMSDVNTGRREDAVAGENRCTDRRPGAGEGAGHPDRKPAPAAQPAKWEKDAGPARAPDPVPVNPKAGAVRGPVDPPKHKRGARGPAPAQVDRVTALRGPDGQVPRPPRSALRSRTLAGLRVRDPEIPYRKYEAASEDLVCSLMERQDRITEELLLRIIDLEYEVSSLREETGRRWK